MVKKSRKIYILGSAIIALASLFLVYFLLISTGVVQVKNEIITITSGSIEATYNGEPVKCESVEVTQGELRKGHTIEAIYTGKVVNVGSAANTYTFKIVDSEGVDVTNKYTIEKLEGTITVNKRPISLRGSNAYKEYDGTPLSTNSKEYTWVSGSLIEGHTIEVSSHGEQTDAGIGENLLDVQIYDANRNVMTQNYDIQVVPGALTVNPIPLVISSGSANKRYDGTALTEDFWQLEHGNLLDLNEDGTPDHRIEAETNGTITEPGKADNTFKYIKVLDIETGNDVTHNYDIDAQHGVLEIKSVALVFKSKSIYKNYDGKPLVANKDDVELFSGELFEGHYYEVEMYELTEVNADKYDYEFKVVIKDQNGLDITDNYDVEYEYGKAEIKGADLAIKTGSDDKEYDGKPLSCEKYEIMSSEFSNGEFTEDNEYILENGDTLIVVDSTKVIDVSFDKYNKLQGVNNVIEFKVLDKDGKDVTKNYNIKDNLSYGTLMITQKQIKVETPSETFEYDGKSHSCSEDPKTTVKVYTDELYDGLVNGDVFKCTELSSLLTPDQGSVLNVPTYKIFDSEGKDITLNYSVSQDKYGKLSYSKKNITIISEKGTKEYDGTPLSVHKYSFIIDEKQYEMDDKFLDNHFIEYTNISEATNAGTVIKNRFEVKIYTYVEVKGVEKKVDVTERFSITKELGELLVTPQKIFVKTLSGTFTYDGQNHYVDNFTLCDDTLDLKTLGISIKVISKTEVKDATSNYGKNNDLKFKVLSLDKNGEPTDKENPNYIVEIEEYGKIIVNPYMIIVWTNTFDYKYKKGVKQSGINGGLLVCEDVDYRDFINGDYSLTSGQLLNNINKPSCNLKTGDTLVIGDVWTSIELGQVVNKPQFLDIYEIVGDKTVSTKSNYYIYEAYGYITVTNPNYDFTIAPTKIAVPYSETNGEIVNTEYAMANNLISSEIIGLDVLIAQGYTYDVVIEGSASKPGTYEKVLKIVDFKLYDKDGKLIDIVGTEGYRIGFMENDIVIYEHTVTITTKTVTEVYSGKELNGKDYEVTVTGLASGHSYIIKQDSYKNIKNVGQVTNKVSIIVKDQYGNDVTSSYYMINKFGTLNITPKEFSIIFDDPYVEKDLSSTDIKGVEATEKDFEYSYEVVDLAPGHKLISFSTDYALSSGEYDIIEYKIIDENDNDVTKNYSVYSDPIYIYVNIV